MPKLCAFGCAPRDVPMHRFPHAKKFPERFSAWVSLVGGKLETPVDYEFYQKKVVCDLHFTTKDRNRNKRLNALAIPSQDLHGTSESILLGPISVDIGSKASTPHHAETALQQSCAAHIDLDHIYCRPERGTSSVFIEKPSPKESLPITEQKRNKDTKENCATINANINTNVVGKEVNPDCGVALADIATINDNIFTNVASEEIIPHCEDSTTINSDIYTNVATEEVASDFEAPNDCYETFTEYDESYDVIDEFLELSPGTESSLPATEQEYKNGLKKDCYETFTESDNIYDVIDEFLVLPSRKEASVSRTGRRRNNEEIKICDNCDKKIVGFRYKCLHCIDYNHCHKCEMQEAHPNHYMIRMPKSPEFEVPEEIIGKMCDEFKSTTNFVKENPKQESILADDESVNNNSGDCDSDVDLSEEVKSLIRKEVTRVVKNKFVDKTRYNGKIKRKMKTPNDTPKKLKIAAQTATINDEGPVIVEMGQNDKIPGIVSENADENYNDHGGRVNNESTPAIATILHDETCPGAVHMALSSDVSRLMIEVIKDGKKNLYKYVDS